WQTMVSAYVFLSAAQRDIMADGGLPRHRLFVKPNFAIPPLTNTAKQTDIVVYAGRLTVAKGVPFLMEAWDRYVSCTGMRRLRLVIAGAGPLEHQVSSWASSRRSVQFAGMLSREDCASLFAQAQAVVVPSQWEETFGLIVVEAMAAGVPPIAPAHGSFPDLITDGTDGILFDPENSSAMVDVLLDLESHPERYRALGRAARETYDRRFTPQENVKQLLQIYEFAQIHPAV
ncbi:MAG: glycosyltransferase family 4 protein, partial [Acidobacteria bacterium]|nr:glycosyltransferase family 4 protein [Acidobacteriota bacterium]